MLFKAFRATKTGKVVIDAAKFHVPVFGDIVRKASIARFARTFGTLISSGVPILEALNITRDTAGNVILANAISHVHDAIREGEPIAAPLSETKVCDEMVVNMIDVGEETGNLDNMLIKVADTYDDQVDTAVEAMTSLMEPIMIIFLGLIIGFIVISLFLPLIKLMTSMS
jgi:type IV pilus assembly protein PilC